ncbi:MAG: 3-dehydroquinate synthase II [Thermoplasmata archaeon]|nr:3-dehydroquinate synthase II [Thermoplasmata archaeon]
MRGSGKERIVLSLESAPPSEVDGLLEQGRRRGFRSWVVPANWTGPGRSGETLLYHREGRFEPLFPAGGENIEILRISHPEELEELLRRIPPHSPIVVEWTHERVIPLENLVARRAGPGATWVLIAGPRELSGALGALEHGADRIVVPILTDAELGAVELLAESPTVQALSWGVADVTAVAPGGLSERVIVDTTSLLLPDEGLLLGSAAAFLFHVPSETVGSRFTAPRPFRINAGAPHSYVLMADGRTRYLSEVQGGDSVFVTRPSGPGRTVRVGRIKIERRPMIHVTARHGGRSCSIFLQEAETVRLTTELGPVATTELRAPSRLIGVALPPARHLGTAIDETIEER